MKHFKRIIIIICAIGTAVLSTSAISARISDITNTKHNLSATPSSVSRTVQATTETQICVFCHTPHKAENIPNAPLWNRADYTETYTPYTSNSIDANDISATPGGSSKLCLSCHDGTIAIGMVNVLNAQENVSITMSGTGAGGVMPDGSYGANTGFTRKLGTNLTNDHPISFTYDSALASADGELRDPASVSHIANRSPGVKPSVPLEDDQVQCTSCHDPHIRDVDISKNIKFLRLNRFQESAPTGGTFNEANDIVCLACHDKLGQAWAQSAHALPSAANETYTTSAAALREFPDNLPVWQASCLNCHDTHTVQGARRLLREGTDSTSTPKSGGNAAQEEVCYTCHSDDGDVLNGQSGATFEVPDIKTDFTTTGNIRMPITTSDQNPTSEIHDVTNADLIESAGNFSNTNRHVECTDCHNPHRVMKNSKFNGTGTTAAGTHDHSPGHTNIASGVLRGSWGVEPTYSSAVFDPTNLPLSFTVKSGDGGSGASDAVGSTHVTREYQICLKCHSNYAYGSNPPMLGNTQGGTSSGTNDLDQYTNQAMEFQAPSNHKGQVSRTDSGASSNFSTDNHRSWHPVMDNTGRTTSERGGMNANNWLSPWNSDVGNQTMYCSDCHGSDTEPATAVPTGGENGNPWGPHGSSNNFILKGDWDTGTGVGNTSRDNDLCFKCHDHSDYGAEGGGRSGFCCDRDDNMHGLHVGLIDTSMRCSFCHVSIPHGWKNKAFLANMNDVGPEVGLPVGTVISDGAVGENTGYTNGPYYMRAFLRISTSRSFAASGEWVENDCGGKDYMRTMCQDP